MSIIHLQQGDLLHRLNRNFDRLEQNDYAPDQLFKRDATGGWPGDTVGRTLLAWASLAHTTGRVPRYLSAVLTELPHYLNEQGYMGPVCTTLDEQTLSGHSWLISGLIESYQLTGEQAITENYANYNWFNRPTWTEPCAIVDALIVSLQLWRLTGGAHYLDDAHHIYFNALGYAQKPHGGFGLENCVGAHDPETVGEDDPGVLYNKTYDVPWCCNMRGAVGLVEAARHAFVHDAPDAGQRISLPFFFNASAEFALSSGCLRLSETTDYPSAGHIRLVIDSCSTSQPISIRLYLPGWVSASTTHIALNGQSVSFKTDAGFAHFNTQLHAGDAIEYGFDIVERQGPLLIPADIAGQVTLRRGPLIIGQTQSGEWQPLNNVIDQDEFTARTERRRILFPAKKLLWPVQH
jgi:DUF1680 family protein